MNQKQNLIKKDIEILENSQFLIEEFSNRNLNITILGNFVDRLERVLDQLQTVDENWKSYFRKLWLDLEIVYAFVLDEEEFKISDKEIIKKSSKKLNTIIKNKLKEKKQEQASRYIKIMKNENCEIEERSKAAEEIGDLTQDNKILQQLLQFGVDASQNDVLQESVGESIAKIWINKGFFDADNFKKLCDYTKLGVKYIISHQKPDWIKEYNLKDHTNLN